MDFKGFNISETSDGLSVSFTHRELFILSKILLSAKFPPDYVFNTNELLNPYINQLIDAVSDRLANLSSPPVAPLEFSRTAPFVEAVFKAIDDAITHGKASTAQRDDLLRLAFKPHKVEGFK